MAAPGRSHYDVLGATMGAGAPELRRAYLDRARRWHPDAGGDSASMRRLNEAWAVLGDPSRRRAYDISLDVSLGARTVDAPTAGHRHASRPGSRHGSRPGSWHGPIDGESDADLLADLLAEPADDLALVAQSGGSRVLTLVPVLLFGGSLASACTGVVLASAQVIGLAGMLLFLSALFMVAMPFLEMARSRQR